MSFLKIFSLNGRTTNIIFILTYVLAYVLKIPVIIAAQYLPYMFMSDFLISISKILAIYIVFAAMTRRLNDINFPRFNAIFLCTPFALRHFVNFTGFAEFGMFALEIFAVLFLSVSKSKESTSQ